MAEHLELVLDKPHWTLVCYIVKLKIRDVEILPEKLRRQNLDLKDPETGVSAVMLAAQEGHIAVVEMLVTAGADIEQENHSGATPFEYAVQNSHPAIARKLHSAGIKLDEDDAAPTVLPDEGVLVATAQLWVVTIVDFT